MTLIYLAGLAACALGTLASVLIYLDTTAMLLTRLAAGVVACTCAGLGVGFAVAWAL